MFLYAFFSGYIYKNSSDCASKKRIKHVYGIVRINKSNVLSLHWVTTRQMANERSPKTNTNKTNKKR